MLNFLSKNIILYSNANGHGYYLYLNIFLVLGVVVVLFYFFPKFKSKQSVFNFTDVLLGITTHLVLVKKKSTIKSIQKAIEKQLGIDYLNANKIQLEEYINQEIPLGNFLNKTTKSQDDIIKLYLIYFSLKFCTYDKDISIEEKHFLEKITNDLGLSKQQFKSLWAMQFITQKQEDLVNQINYSKLVLELEDNINLSRERLDKAYRKLVVIYHPEKIELIDEPYHVIGIEIQQKIEIAYAVLINNNND